MNLQEDLIDVFDNITKFLDYESLCKLACVSKTCNEMAEKELRKRPIWVVYVENREFHDYYIFHGSYQQAINQLLRLYMDITYDSDNDYDFCDFSEFLEKYGLKRTIRNFLFWDSIYVALLEGDISDYNAKLAFIDENKEYIDNFNNCSGQLEQAAQDVINHVFSDKNIAIYINEYLTKEVLGLLTLNEFKKEGYWPPIDSYYGDLGTVYLLEKKRKFSYDLVVEEIPDFNQTLSIADPSDYNATPAII